jgi:uncharacterized protein YfaS (alpha-2-macroglobulin family)
MRKLVFALLVLPTLGIQTADSAPTTPPPPPHGVLGVYVRGPERLLAGTPAAVRIAAHWATSEQSSGPFPGVDIDVRLSDKEHRKALFHGRTDGQGLVDARFTVPDWPDGKYTMTIDAQSGARHRTETHEIELAPSAKLLLESDKPLYQPAQTIHLRALAVRPLDGKPLSSGEVTFTLTDPRGNRIFKESRPLSSYGVASVDFALADEILTGSWRAQVSLSDDKASSALDLSIERYSLPKFKIGLETDKSWYRPGETIQLSIDGRYFFGKPVAAGKVSVGASIASGGMRVNLAEHRGTLDADGKLQMQLELPSSLSFSDGALKLHAELTDRANHREETARELTYAADAARVDVVSETEWMVPGVANHVWIAATRPDGTPLANADVSLTADGQLQNARTDAIGVAALELTPQRTAKPGPCGRNQVALLALLRHDGVTTEVKKCVRTMAAGALLLRTDRAIYPLGAPMQVELQGLGPDGVAYIDVIKDGQTVDTQRVTLRGGHGAVTLQPDERRFGTLALEAYRIAPDGTQTRAGKLVYVERPAALKVDVHTEATYRPGEPGRIRLKVVDAQSGKGAQASVGVVMVDQSLLALKAMKPGVARVYFTLADEATRPQLRLAARPGGYTVERLIEEGQLDALKDEAARVLLAGAAPPWNTGWEVDPWQKRIEERDAQLARLGEAFARYAPTHDCGEPVRGSHWRWRRQLIGQMIFDGALPAHDAHDPWGRPISVDKIIEQSGLGKFDDFASEQVQERMTQIYVALARSGVEKTLPADPKKKGAVVLALADLQKLAATGKLPKYLLHDPWGQDWHLVERTRAYKVARMRSRWLLASAGPNGLFGDKDDLIAVDASWGPTVPDLHVMAMGRDQFDSIGVGGIGLMGRGAGGGGVGYGFGSGSGRLGTIGHGVAGGVAGGEERVRRDFPETMLWRPEVITDADGNATLDVTMADSITTWKLFAEAIAADGRLGQATADVRVFQDFFVDLDLPPVITQHDELSVPVAVYNYLATPQRVTLTLEDGRWFTRSGEATQTIDLEPSQVGVRYFRIRALGVGRQKLLVRAHGSVASDAIEKSIELRPDGVERSVAWQDRLEPGAVEHSLTLPANAIADASVANLKLYPSTATHVIEGLDSMLRMPGGCFEQTSSTTYPNALILDYLRKTRKATPDVEKKAKEYLTAGWQRLVSFEVPGGGFSWFGQAPANQILTAYGLEEFRDMSKVMAIDERVIKRTQDWLVGKQRSDGSWAPDTYFINEGATNHFNSDVLRITAYLAVALEHSGYRGAALDKARGYVEKKMLTEPPKDAYTLALAGELFSSSSGNTLDAVLDGLWQARADLPDGKTTTFSSKEKTPTYGDGKSGTVETTALATYAMLQARAPLARVDRAVGYLLSSKDTFGNWYSTQATILSLKALLAYGGAQQPARGKVRVLVDGKETAELDIDANKLALTAIDLPALTRPGKHDVRVRYEGTGQIAYQLVDRWFEPRTGQPKPTEAPELAVATRVDGAKLAAGATLVERIEASTRKSIDMPIVTAGLPPGFDVDGEELDKLVKSKVVDKIQRTPTGLVMYLTRLDPGAPLKVSLHLRARFPERVQIPAASLYEYYRPERAAAGEPVTVTVGG